MNPTIQADIDRLRARAQVHAIAREDSKADAYFAAANALANISEGNPVYGQEEEIILKRGLTLAQTIGIRKHDALTYARDIVRWLNNGWIKESDLITNLQSGWINRERYEVLLKIMENRPEEKVVA